MHLSMTLSDIIWFNVSAHLNKHGAAVFYFPGGQGVKLNRRKWFHVLLFIVMPMAQILLLHIL